MTKSVTIKSVELRHDNKIQAKYARKYMLYRLSRNWVGGDWTLPYFWFRDE